MITNVTGLIDINYQRVRTISVCGWGGARLGMRGFIRGEGGVQKSNKREAIGIKLIGRGLL